MCVSKMMSGSALFSCPGPASNENPPAGRDHAVALPPSEARQRSVIGRVDNGRTVRASAASRPCSMDLRAAVSFGISPYPART